jgi:hypothetical protein
VSGLIASAAAQFSIFDEHGHNAVGTLQTIGRFLALSRRASWPCAWCRPPTTRSWPSPTP